MRTSLELYYNKLVLFSVMTRFVEQRETVTHGIPKYVTKSAVLHYMIFVLPVSESGRFLSKRFKVCTKTNVVESAAAKLHQCLGL